MYTQHALKLDLIDSVSVAVAVIFSSVDLRQSDSTYVHLACLSGHSFFGTLPMVLSCLVLAWLVLAWLDLSMCVRFQQVYQGSTVSDASL